MRPIVYFHVGGELREAILGMSWVLGPDTRRGCHTPLRKTSGSSRASQSTRSAHPTWSHVRSDIEWVRATALAEEIVAFQRAESTETMYLIENESSHDSVIRS